MGKNLTAKAQALANPNAQTPSKVVKMQNQTVMRRQADEEVAVIPSLQAVVTNLYERIAAEEATIRQCYDNIEKNKYAISILAISEASRQGVNCSLGAYFNEDASMLVVPQAAKKVEP